MAEEPVRVASVGLSRWAKTLLQFAICNLPSWHT